MDSSRAQCCQVIANVRHAVQSIVTKCDVWREQMHWNSKRRHVQMPKGCLAVGVYGFRGHDQCRSTQKIGIRSETEKSKVNIKQIFVIRDWLTTSGSDRTGV
jgi:hypothetical protein